ncbi:hypothetical protein TUM17580_16190 [Citrobacter farmeri]|nr:hypothetical protein TUM17580_16190 [Citrobacter farmeri]
MKKTLSLDEISIRLLYPLSKRKKQQSDWGDFQQYAVMPNETSVGLISITPSGDEAG